MKKILNELKHRSLFKTINHDLQVKYLEQRFTQQYQKSNLNLLALESL